VTTVCALEVLQRGVADELATESLGDPCGDVGLGVSKLVVASGLRSSMR
jgi:hypothetical protein